MKKDTARAAATIAASTRFLIASMASSLMWSELSTTVWIAVATLDGRFAGPPEDAGRRLGVERAGSFGEAATRESGPDAAAGLRIAAAAASLRIIDATKPDRAAAGVAAGFRVASMAKAQKNMDRANRI